MSYLLVKRSLENPFVISCWFLRFIQLSHFKLWGIDILELCNNRPTFKKELYQNQVKLDFKFLDPRRCSLLVPFKA